MYCSHFEFRRVFCRLWINQVYLKTNISVYDGQCLILSEVTSAMIKKQQALKRQGSFRQCQNAQLIFNSRKVKTEKAPVAHIVNSLTTTIDSKNGETVAVVLFGDGQEPSQEPL